METLKIDILNPKAKRLLQELANLDLINIRKEAADHNFKSLLNDIRNSNDTPSLDEITKEVEAVRGKRYAGKAR